MLDILVPKITGEKHTFKVTAYKGLGRIPKNLSNSRNVQHRILLQRLPQLLNGCGRTFQGYGNNYKAAVIVVCDLDNKCRREFRQELLEVLNNCHTKPETRFCIAIEEGESWLLGDIDAITSAYPTCKRNTLEEYENDSICGTWEIMADALYPGGSQVLAGKGYQISGKEKTTWAEKISPHINIDNNRSPSFQYFKSKIDELIAIE